MNDDYSALTLAHFRQPRNVGLLPVAADVLQVEAGGVAQEVLFRFSARVRDGRVAAVGWHAYGCPHAIAAASLVSEWLVGRRAEEILRLDWRKLFQPLGIPEKKTGRLLVLEDALHALARGMQTIQ